MNIVAYLDNDQLNKPNTGKAEVYTVEDEGTPVTKEQLVQKYPSVFSDEVGLLEGDSHPPGSSSRASAARTAKSRSSTQGESPGNPE